MWQLKHSENDSVKPGLKLKLGKLKIILPILFLLLVTVGCASAAQLTVDGYTKSLMHFDNGQGSIVYTDATGRAWSGYANPIQSTASVMDSSTSSLYCQRSGTQFIFTNNVSGMCPGTQDFTIEFQAKRSSFGTNQRVFGNMGDDFTIAHTTIDLRFNSNNKLQFGVGDGTNARYYSSIHAISDTNWHTYTFQRKGQYLLMFIDGKYEGMLDIGSAFSLYNSTTRFCIGGSGALEFDSFDGYIDEFRYSVGTARVADKWMDWYAIGDSNTDATNTGLTPNDGSWCYIYTTAADNNESADHCMAGYGQLTSWGIANIASYYPNPKNYVIMLGSNDAHTGVSARTAAQNVKDMYNYSTSHGSKTLICVPLMAASGTGYYAISYQQQWMRDFESNLTGYPYILAYDSTDSNPGNRQPDAINSSYFEADGVHLNEAGQVALGHFIWQELAGRYTSSATSGTAPLTVQLNYSNKVVNSSISVDFENDGKIDSSEYKPVHTYGRSGSYAVNVTSINDFGTFKGVKTNFITVTAQTAPSTADQIMAVIRHWLFGLTAVVA